MAVIPCQGGLDLVTQQSLIDAGALIECRNFEVARETGYARSNTLEPYDGGPSAQAWIPVLIMTYPVPGDTVGGSVGTNIALQNPPSWTSPEARHYIGQVVYVSTGWVYAIFPPGVIIDPTVAYTIYTQASLVFTNATGYTVRPISQFQYVPSYLKTVIATYAQQRRAEVTKVPGRRESHITGLMSYKDETYAARDYTAVDTLITVSDGMTNQGAWGSGVNYAVNDLVTSYQVLYRCTTAHLSAAGTEPGLTTDSGYPHLPLTSSEVWQVWADSSYILSANGQFSRAFGSPYNTEVLVGPEGVWGGEVVQVTPVTGTANGSTVRLSFSDEHGYYSPARGVTFADSTTNIGCPQPTDTFYLPTSRYRGGMGFGTMGEVDWYTGWIAFGSVTARTDQTQAGLYKSSNAGWREIDMMREVTFTLGTAAMASIKQYTPVTKPADTTVQDTGFVSSSAQENIFGSGWLDLANTTGTGGGLYAKTPTGAAGYKIFQRAWLKAPNLSTIPLNAKITGIQVEIIRKVDPNPVPTNEYARDATIALTGVGSVIGQLPNGKKISADKADKATNWTTADVTVLYGGSTDLWGVSSISVADVQSTDFGVLMSVLIYGGGDGTIDLSAWVNYVAVKVFYINATATCYVSNVNASSPTTVPINIIRVHKTNGTYDGGTASGVLTIQCDQDFYKTRLLGSGNKVYADSGLLTEYCTLSGQDYPVTMPSEFDMDAAESQYVHINENYYGDEQYTSLYGANGAGPGFAYDGTNFIRIWPGISQPNKPRQIARQGDLLVLAYESGMTLFSAEDNDGIFDPLDYLGEHGSAEVDFGQKVTGLMSLEGDTLAVFLRSRIDSLRGLVPAAFQRQVLCPHTGAIEYTVVNMGFPVYLDFFGVSTLDTSDKYGDFVAGRLSKKVWPWLAPRVQTDQRFPETGPILALPVRNKNQCRWFFGDGRILTMTLQPGAEPQFTMQDYTTTGIYIQDMIVRAGCSVVHSDGTEHLFAGFKTSEGATYGRTEVVYELDIGNLITYPIDLEALSTTAGGYITVAALADGAKLTHWDRFSLLIKVTGTATIAASRWQNFLESPPTVLAVSTFDRQSIVFGSPSTAVQSGLKNRMATAQLGIDAFACSVRIDAADGTDLPYIVQEIIPFGESRGTSPGNLRST